MTCDVYEIVTNQIINRITESGKLPWFQPWVNVMGGDGLATSRRLNRIAC